MRVFIGADDREPEAARVAAKTLREVTHGEIEPEFLRVDKLAAHGLLTRAVDRRGGQDYDLVSNESTSTRFKISRFLVPMLCQSGLALFVDSDVVFLRDPREMLLVSTAGMAVSVVKRNHMPTTQWKMVNQSQMTYPCKNWSSVMVFDCDHPANRRLTLWDINHRHAQHLHEFYWLGGDEIGDLDPVWNWLVGEQPKPDNVGIAHFTLGGPFIPGWHGAEHDDIWLEAAK